LHTAWVLALGAGLFVADAADGAAHSQVDQTLARAGVARAVAAGLRSVWDRLLHQRLRRRESTWRGCRGGSWVNLGQPRILNSA
jgi:hypothetical protein